MKRLLVIGLTLSFSAVSLAANVKLNLAPLDEVISSSDIILSQVQAKVQCWFKAQDDDKKSVMRERYVLTRLDRLDEGRYRIRTGKAVLNAWIPEYRLEKCGYRLITLGEDLEGHALIGNIALLESGLDEADANTILSKRLSAILIVKHGERDSARLVDSSQN